MVSDSTHKCFVHMCIEKSSSDKNINTIAVMISKTDITLVKYFTPQDMKTISLQNNRKLMLGI